MFYRNIVSCRKSPQSHEFADTNNGGEAQRIGVAPADRRQQRNARCLQLSVLHLCAALSIATIMTNLIIFGDVVCEKWKSHPPDVPRGKSCQAACLPVNDMSDMCLYGNKQVHFLATVES